MWWAGRRFEIVSRVHRDGRYFSEVEGWFQGRSTGASLDVAAQRSEAKCQRSSHSSARRAV
jgi:hypothetical protein